MELLLAISLILSVVAMYLLFTTEEPIQESLTEIVNNLSDEDKKRIYEDGAFFSSKDHLFHISIDDNDEVVILHQRFKTMCPYCGCNKEKRKCGC